MEQNQSSSQTPAFTNIESNDDLLKLYYEEMKENAKESSETVHNLYIDFSRYKITLKESDDKFKVLLTDTNPMIYSVKII